MPTAWTSVAGRFAVHLFEGRVSIDDMDFLQTMGERWSEKHPAKRVELVVVFPSDTRLSSEERTRMARLVRSQEEHRIASGTVILAEGLLAAMQRGMLTGLMMLAPAPHPTKVFGTLPDALRWLYPHVQRVCGERLRLEELTAALDEVVLQFRTRPDRPTQAAT